MVLLNPVPILDVALTNANQLQTTCDNLRSVVAAGRLGRGRSRAPSAFVGCISGLGGSVWCRLSGGLIAHTEKAHSHQFYPHK
jgi:hypothetical protein